MGLLIREHKPFRLPVGTDNSSDQLLRRRERHRRLRVPRKRLRRFAHEVLTPDWWKARSISGSVRDWDGRCSFRAISVELRQRCPLRIIPAIRPWLIGGCGVRVMCRLVPAA